MEHDVIDFHTHPYLSEDQCICRYGNMADLSPVGCAEKVREDMLRSGAGHFCGSVIASNRMPWTGEFAFLRELNRSALKLREMLGDVYTPGFHIHPWFVKESIQEIEYMASQDVRLIGELVPYAQGGYSYGDPGMDEILKAAAQYRMTVSFHSTDDDEADKMVKAHPEINFVAAHPGEHDRVIRHGERLRRYPNYYLDLSGTGLARLGVARYLADQAGADRILYGSDYPINNPGMYVQGVLYEEFTEEERENIFHRNAERLLRL